MSLKLIDELLESWNDPNYEGLNPDHFNFLKSSKSEDLINIKLYKDIEEQRKIRPNMNNIVSYNSNQIRKYYNDHNFGKKGYKIEDKVNKYYNDYEQIVIKIIKKNTKDILEVGFNSGILITILLQHTQSSVTSIDMMNYLYTWYGKLFVDFKFPGRHTLLMSTLSNLIPFRSSQNNKYDIFWIRGDYPNLYDTIIGLRDHAKEHTLVILDSICPHRNFGLGPYIEMLKLIQDKILVLEEHIKIGSNYNTGIALLRYHSPLTRSSSIVTIYKDIELYIPLKEFEEYVYTKSEDTGFSNLVVKKYMRKLMSLEITLSDDLLNHIKESFNIHIE